MVRLIFAAVLIHTSVTAFTHQFSSLALTTSSRRASLSLYAKKKKNNSSKPRTSSGGAGFGSVSSASTSKDTATNRKNNGKVEKRAQIETETDDDGLELAFQEELERRNNKRQAPTEDDMGAAERNEYKQLMATYTKEFEHQELQKDVSHPQRLVQVSSNPLIFTIDEFIEPELCKKVQSNGDGCFNLLYPERVADLVFNGQESEMDGLLFLEATSEEHKNMKRSPDYPDGLHVDTNNQCWERHVTCILYLNDVPEHCGGATVFPIARALPNDPALQASRRLLIQKASHTRSKIVQDTNTNTKDALLLESRIGTNFTMHSDTDTAIRIQPKAGRLLVFFSRYANGEQDPRTWHSGERIHDDNNNNNNDSSTTKKRIINLFKQVDYGDKEPPTQGLNILEDFLAPQIHEQRNWLQALALTKTPIKYKYKKE
ncbi:MAG: hypothetical protein ACI8RD_005883 [Bacillariaceae sp.]|jgi:hypothetical protein